MSQPGILIVFILDETPLESREVLECPLPVGFCVAQNTCFPGKLFFENLIKAGDEGGISLGSRLCLLFVVGLRCSR